MLQRIKIKNIPALFSVLKCLLQFYYATSRVRLNYDSIREFVWWQRGFVDLSHGNYKFYANIFPRLIDRFQESGTTVTILDVGANDGWFAKVVYRFSGPDTSVISFEPLRSMIPKLDFLAKRYTNYRYENIAVGDSNDKINITEYSTSGLSSLKGLSSTYSYSSQYFDTSVANKYPVNIVKIDQYLADHEITSPLILKIDTQGFEFEVLNGARQALSVGQIKAVIVEVMTIGKYEGAVLYPKIFEFLHTYGFTLFDVHPSYYEPDGTLSEFDCAFIKR